MVTRSQIPYFGRANCCQLDNGTAQVIATTDLGPRVICYRFVGGENMLGELGPEAVLKSDLGEYHLWGGHRLWHAPEASPRTYCPDDGPVAVELVGEDGIRLTQPVEPATHIEKEMLVKLDAGGTKVTVVHKLTNRGLWPVELAAWCPTVMRGGGTTIIPNEPYIPEEEKVLPARPIAVWHYTDLSDPRLTFGRKYIRVRADRTCQPQLKLGVMNKQGWAAYLCGGALFVKRFPFIEDAAYPDFGCNFETYTAADFMEVESLGPLVTLGPDESTSHTECWWLFGDIQAGDTEDAIDEFLEQNLP